MNVKEYKDFINKTEKLVNSLEDGGISEFSHLVRELRENYTDFKEGGEALIKEGDVLKIGIVGQVKAGKSSFLNSLFFNGDSVLPKASTPMTAGLTVLEYADSNSFEVEYYTSQEWEEFKKQSDAYSEIEKEVRSNKDNQGAPESFIQKEIKSRTSEVMQSAYELVSRCGQEAKAKIGKGAEEVPFNNYADLQKTLNKYVGANGDYTSVVKSLRLRMNDPRLKGVRIVDTPGVNDPIVSRENKTKEFLHSCHGVFFLSYSSRFFDSVDVNFLNTRIGNQGVGTVLMLASKYDDVLQDQGMKYRDDIEEADNQSRKSLERRFRTQKTEIANQSIDIRFDTTSGISYALATKKESDWDEMERHVNSRMIDLFPSAFGSRADSIDTYLLLANLEQIRDEYLDKMFVANKDNIIKKKLTDYFDQNFNTLADISEELTKSVGEKITQLESTDLKEIYTQQQEQDELFSVLKGEFAYFLSQFSNSLQTAKDQLNEEIRQPRFYTLPTETVTIEVTYKGMVWGHNTDPFYTKGIDTQQLKNDILEAIEAYCKEWQSAWKAHFTKARDLMFDKFCEAITEFSKNMKSLTFSDRYYRQLMSQLLSDIERYGIIKLQDINNKYASELSTLCDSQSMRLSSRKYECKESGVQARLDSDATDIIEPAQRMLNNKLESFSREVLKAVDDCVKPVIPKLNSLKGSIDEKLKSAGKEYLDGLKKQIEDKEASLKKVKALQSVATPLNNIITQSV